MRGCGACKISTMSPTQSSPPRRTWRIRSRVRSENARNIRSMPPHASVCCSSLSDWNTGWTRQAASRAILFILFGLFEHLLGDIDGVLPRRWFLRLSCNSRLARRAARGSCVTITMVRPSALNSSRKPMICRLVSGSRLPVGSSARITAGSLASIRAKATRCCWPTLNSHGLWCSRSPKPTRSSRATARSAWAFFVHLGEKQRNLHVFQRRKVGDQIERLEHEADLLSPQPRTFARVHIVDRLILQENPALGGREHPAQHQQQGALAAAAGTDDRDEIASRDVNRGVIEGRDRLAAMPIGFADVFHLQHGSYLLGEKGDRSNLCEAPCGPFRQIGPVPFFPSYISWNVAHGSSRAARRAGK